MWCAGQRNCSFGGFYQTLPESKTFSFVCTGFGSLAEPEYDEHGLFNVFRRRYKLFQVSLMCDGMLPLEHYEN